MRNGSLSYQLKNHSFEKKKKKFQRKEVYFEIVVVNE